MTTVTATLSTEKLPSSGTQVLKLASPTLSCRREQIQTSLRSTSGGGTVTYSSRGQYMAPCASGSFGDSPVVPHGYVHLARTYLLPSNCCSPKEVLPSVQPCLRRIYIELCKQIPLHMRSPADCPLITVLTQKATKLLARMVGEGQQHGEQTCPRRTYRWRRMLCGLAFPGKCLSLRQPGNPSFTRDDALLTEVD